jgi:hypothetical protein
MSGIRNTLSVIRIVMGWACGMFTTHKYLIRKPSEKKTYVVAGKIITSNRKPEVHLDIFNTNFLPHRKQFSLQYKNQLDCTRKQDGLF